MICWTWLFGVHADFSHAMAQLLPFVIKRPVVDALASIEGSGWDWSDKSEKDMSGLLICPVLKPRPSKSEFLSNSHPLTELFWDSMPEYSTDLEEIGYSKNGNSILEAADAVYTREDTSNLENDIEKDFPGQEVYWFAYHKDPSRVFVVFVGGFNGVKQRVRRIDDRPESEM